MNAILNKFFRSQDGAITVDWMLLTAALLTLGIAVGYSVSDGAEAMAENTGEVLGEAEIPELTF